MTPRRLPAYAKDLADARRRGKTLRNPTVTVWLHWRPRPTLGYGVVVPDQDDPGQLDWDWCSGLEIMVYVRGDHIHRVWAAVRSIRVARPRGLMVVDLDDEKIISIVRVP